MLPNQEFSDFLFRLCHEMRTPIRTMRAHTELLQLAAGKSPEGISASAGFVVDGAKRLDLLADGLVRYAIASQIDRSSFQWIGADVVLRNALARMDKDLGARAGRVDYAELPKVFANLERLSDLFEYLIGNAVVHSGQESPAIEVGCNDGGDVWKFRVENRGAVIEERYLDSVFAPFTRIDRNSHQGPGLGLSISRAIVERHGGKIWAEPHTGGAIICFTLPNAPDTGRD